MNNRSAAYFKRKKIFNKEVLHPTDLKSLLKGEFFSTKNLMVKRHIIKTYEELFEKKG
jgi:hypothetical protein